MHRLKFLLLLSAVLFTSGCMDLRPQTSDPALTGLPEQFSLYNPAPAPEHPWWLALNSPELSTLIEQGLADNLSLQEAWARLAQARATAIKSGAALYPDLTVDGGMSHRQSNSSESGRDSVELFSLGLNTSFELDLWGRVRAGAEGAQLTMQAGREDVNTLSLSLSSSIGESWIELLSQRQQEQQLLIQLDLNRKLLELIRMRFSMSRSTALDIYQQEQTISGLEGGLIKTRSRQQLQLNQLALLIGVSAGADLKLSHKQFPQIPSIPPTGLPADLMARRPDIRSAGLRLQSAHWKVAAARADRLPKINLGAAFSNSAGILDILLENWILKLAASITGSIFDAGYGQAEVERTRAVADERLAAYHNTVLTAIREVEDALAWEQQYRNSIINLDHRLELVTMSYREATHRYLNGLSDFLPVLREQLNQITFQLERIQTEASLLKARISLYKALGGSWMELLPAPDRGGSS